MRIWFHKWLGFHWDFGRWVGIGDRLNSMWTLNLGFVSFQRCWSRGPVNQE